MKLARHLYGQNPDAKFFDYYERLLYNVRYGTQDRNGMLMYYVSMKPGEYKTFGTPLDSFWCCTGTGSEEYTKLNDSIYWHGAGCSLPRGRRRQDGVREPVHSVAAGLERARAEAANGDEVPRRMGA